MERTNEIKAIMRKLKESAVNESLLHTVNEEDETKTENDVSETDLVLAKLEDILSRFEKVLAISEGDEEEPEENDMGDEEASEGEEEPEENDMEDEEASEGEEEPEENDMEDEEAKESFSLERRVAELEKRFTESRRRRARRSFIR